MANLALEFPRADGDTSLPLGRAISVNIVPILSGDVAAISAALGPANSIDVVAVLDDDIISISATFATPISVAVAPVLSDAEAAISATFATPVSINAASALADDVAAISAEFVLIHYVAMSAQLADDVATFSAYVPITIELDEGFTMADSTSFGLTTANVLIAESNAHQEVYTAWATATLTINNTQIASDIIAFIHDMNVAESVTTQSVGTLQGFPLFSVNESNVATSVTTNNLLAAVSINEAQQYVSSVAGIYDVVVDYSYTAAQALSALASANVSVNESATAIDALIHSAIVTVGVDESYQSTESTEFQATALIAVAELVTALSPVDTANKSFYTYALNTLLGATSRYGNYGFNSFAATDEACYGANDTGLYLLEGDNDAGYTIPAGIRSNMSDLASEVMEGTKHKTVSHAYVGMSSDGNMVLQVRASSGNDTATNTYSVVQNGIAAKDTTRVQLGKGVKARYWQFALINENGKNFDIDTFEFLPIPMTRRI